MGRLGAIAPTKTGKWETVELIFSQPWGKDEPLANVIRSALKLAVPPRYRTGLLVKVLFFTTPEERRRWKYRGSYRHIAVHGLWPGEFDMLWHLSGEEFRHAAVITLKLPRDFPVEETVRFVAHEAGHHVSYAKTGRFGERTADKYADQVVAKWNKVRGDSPGP